MHHRILSLSLLLLLPPAIAVAQDWNDDQLLANVPGFQDDTLPKRLLQIGKLLEHQAEARTAMCARIHGDHREYLLKIERLLGELSDERWPVREEAERTLDEIGGRAQKMIQQRVEKFTTLEESIRCKRILEAIAAKGTEAEDREIRTLRGLVATTLYMQPDARLLQALRSALGHSDPLVVDLAIRSLGGHGGDEEADAVKQMLAWKGGVYRQATLQALARMPCPRALAICGELLSGKDLSRGEACGVLRTLRQRKDGGELLASLAAHHPDPVVAAAAKLRMPAPLPGEGPKVKLVLADRSPLETIFRGWVGDATVAGQPVETLAQGEISFADADILDFPDHALQKVQNTRVFLSQGSLVTGELRSLDPDTIKLHSPVFGELTLPRNEVQGIAIDPELDRLVGASTDHDRVRLKSNEFVDGQVRSVGGGKVVVALAGGGDKEIALAEVSGLLMTRPKTQEPDSTVYVRIDLTNGDRVIGFVVGSTPSHMAFSAPLLGAAVVPITQVNHIEIGVGGGAMWGFTLIADYSDNRVVEVDEQGRVVFEMNEVFGAWDAECLDNGNLLITEFSVSRVQEVDRKGNVVWSYEELKNPYRASRLANGNTLIADTFAGRVIEVTKNGEIVWKYDKEIRPFHCDRLVNGNTLIADVMKDRVIEVSPQGEIVWEVKNMNNVHDAERLPNGNTLITLRSAGKVIEVDRDGKTVWELSSLSSPSAAKRLSNGHTLVAENGAVREFDRRANVVWKKEMTWAVQANRY